MDLSTLPFRNIKRAIAAIPGARRAKRALFGAGTGGLRVPVVRAMDRGAPPSSDRARLAAEYRRGPLSGETDSFILYRIIGNDLPPRHQKGQSRENLAFMLANEPVLPGCEKRFVVNRIVDPQEEEAIVRLLDDAGFSWLRIPFDPQEYRRVPWDVEGVPVEYAPWSDKFSRLSEAQQGRIFKRLYRHKNNYVMNNNGARNAALREGRGLAKWVLPWDGNCFVTAAAWKEITAAVIDAPELPYFIVPMARITDNERLLEQAFRPEANGEPQILFRRDAALEFNPEFPYGRRPKVELLWRLGVPGPWDAWGIEPWDPPCPPYAAQAGAFGDAGWVARLASGQAHLEGDGSATISRKRALARIEAGLDLLDRLDDKTRPPVSGLCLVSESVRGADSERLRSPLLQAAGKALERGPYSVTQKTTLPPSGDPHDYWHPAPYYWPHPLRIPGLPYVRRENRRVPGTRLYEPLSERYDRTRLQRLFDDTFVLALAWRETGELRFAQHGAVLVRSWFLDPETAMNPHLEYAQVRRGHDGNRGSSSGLIEMKDLYYFLDGVRLLEQAGVLTVSERGRLRDWFGRYLHWLRTSPQGRKERASGNNHGTYYDLQVASIAAYLGEARLVRETLRDSRSRLLQQFEKDGRQPEEMSRTTTAHYCCFNLQGWAHLARLAETWGEDLWSFQGSDGRGIRGGLEWLLPHMGRPWPYEQIEPFDPERFHPLYHIHRVRYGGSLPVEPEAPVPPPGQIKPLYFPHDGIPPFWQFMGWWQS